MSAFDVDKGASQRCIITKWTAVCLELNKILSQCLWSGRHTLTLLPMSLGLYWCMLQIYIDLGWICWKVESHVSKIVTFIKLNYLVIQLILFILGYNLQLEWMRG